MAAALDPNSGMSAAARRSHAAYWGTRGQAVKQLIERPRLVRPHRGLLVFRSGSSRQAPCERQSLVPWPSQV